MHCMKKSKWPTQTALCHPRMGPLRFQETTLFFGSRNFIYSFKQSSIFEATKTSNMDRNNFTLQNLGRLGIWKWKIKFQKRNVWRVKLKNTCIFQISLKTFILSNRTLSWIHLQYLEQEIKGAYLQYLLNFCCFPF